MPILWLIFPYNCAKSLLCTLPNTKWIWWKLALFLVLCQRQVLGFLDNFFPSFVYFLTTFALISTQLTSWELPCEISIFLYLQFSPLSYFILWIYTLIPISSTQGVSWVVLQFPSPTQKLDNYLKVLSWGNHRTHIIYFYFSDITILLCLISSVLKMSLLFQEEI